jgi:hypothetical protein
MNEIQEVKKDIVTGEVLDDLVLKHLGAGTRTQICKTVTVWCTGAAGTDTGL